MTEPTREQLLHLADRARRGVLLPAEYDRLAAGIIAMADERDAARDRLDFMDRNTLPDLRRRTASDAATIQRWRHRAEQAEAAIDATYRERAHLVALLAALYPSHIGHTDPSAPDWAVVIVEAPGGQLSWHIAERDMDLFGHVMPTNRICRGWDGHTTDEKYDRIRRLTASAKPLPI
ncbi:WDGH domain-containing protein [Streptomyces sp. NBC_01022]|uniref:WDGH domain-containing protein n=1 Tax=Streptomyces sp. NBC_01022 TaxID=2903723 RepID=UPI002DD92167|nr:hypothetical protein [Streptomyces sp. NBC_01022]WRZ84818.1 hypothetical protein OG316_33440 [Streptomyces sp. NBC_01022]